MQKKSSGSDTITKDYLDETLDSRLTELEDRLDVKLAMQKDGITREVRDIITENNSAIFTRIDPILSEVENARIDRELGTEQLRKLEKRVEKLERS